MNWTFKPTSSGDRLVSMLGHTVSEFHKNADKAVKQLAEDTVKVAKYLVESQNFKRTPLTPEWRARKARLGLDPRVLMATGGYVKSFRTLRKANAEYEVTCDLAKMQLLEFGWKNRKPTPHWEPVMLAMQDRASMVFAHEVLREMGLG